MGYNDGLTVNMQLREEIVKTVHLPQTPPVNNFNEWAIYGWMCYFWMNVSFMDECVIFGWMCYFWMNMPFLDECAIYGWICHFWMNVLLLDECAIYGWMCHLRMNMPLLGQNFMKKLFKKGFWLKKWSKKYINLGL